MLGSVEAEVGGWGVAAAVGRVDAFRNPLRAYVHTQISPLHSITITIIGRSCLCGFHGSRLKTNLLCLMA